jgi:microcystin-dependent protein
MPDEPEQLEGPFVTPYGVDTPISGLPAATVVNPADLIPIVQSGNTLYAPASLFSAVPTGTILDFAGGTAPAGYLLCDGAAVSRTDYSALYAVLGGSSSPWGQGDGTTTFNVPDLRGRTAVGMGLGTGLTDRALGAKGGEEKHALTIAELAAHTHVQNSHNHTQNAHNHTQNAHTHTQVAHSHDVYRTQTTVSGGNVMVPSGTTTNPYATSSETPAINAATAVNIAATATNIAATATNQNTGSNTGHNTMPPFTVVNKIIKA